MVLSFCTTLSSCIQRILFISNPIIGIKADLSDSAFTAKLDEQLSVYVTIGTPKIESPMWFQFTGQIYSEDFLKFKSSQADHIAS